MGLRSTFRKIKKRIKRNIGGFQRRVIEKVAPIVAPGAGEFVEDVQQAALEETARLAPPAPAPVGLSPGTTPGEVTVIGGQTWIWDGGRWVEESDLARLDPANPLLASARAERRAAPAISALEQFQAAQEPILARQAFSGVAQRGLAGTSDPRGGLAGRAVRGEISKLAAQTARERASILSEALSTEIQEQLARADIEAARRA